MDIPFTVPGHEQIPLTLRVSLIRGAKILCQGEPLKQIPGRKFVLPLADGTELTLGLKSNGLDLLVPNVVYNDQVIRVAPPLPIYQMMLVYAPLGLIILGGAIGGACGGIAAGINLAIFRSSHHVAVKVLLALLSFLVAATVWVIAAVLVALAFRSH